MENKDLTDVLKRSQRRQSIMIQHGDTTDTDQIQQLAMREDIDDEKAIDSIIEKVCPLDTKEVLTAAREKVKEMRAGMAGTCSQTMSRAIPQFGRFALMMTETFGDARMVALKTCANQLKENAPFITGENEGGGVEESLSLLNNQMGITKEKSNHNQKIDDWLDELHESIALLDYERAVESVDRLRAELNNNNNTTDSLLAKQAKRLNRLTDALKEKLLFTLRSSFMDANVVARVTVALCTLGMQVEARDCLLTGLTDRLHDLAMMLSLQSDATVKQRHLLKCVKDSVQLYNHAFSDPMMRSGVLMWMEAILEKYKLKDNGGLFISE